MKRGLTKEKMEKLTGMTNGTSLDGLQLAAVAAAAADDDDHNDVVLFL